MNILRVVESKIVQGAKSTVFYKYRLYFEAMYSLICLAAPIAFAGVALAWYTQGPTPIQQISLNNTYEVQENQPLDLGPVATITASESKPVAYEAWVSNAKGLVVYRFPMVHLPKDATTDISLTFPRLGKGAYNMYAKIHYLDNPLTHNNLKISLGRVSVY